MATRRPIVLVSGRLKELPAGDTVAGANAGGAVASTLATLEVAPGRYGYAEVAVSDANSTAQSAVEARLVPSDDFDADDLDDVAVNATAADGAINFTLSCAGPLAGSYGVRYRLETP